MVRGEEILGKGGRKRESCPLFSLISFAPVKRWIQLKLENCIFIFFQVESMSIELEDAKTKVAQFQKQCEEYLVVIVQQKRDADEQQKVEILLYSITLLLRLIIGLPVASKKKKQNG